MKTLLKGGILGGLIVFLWGSFSWMVLPFHGKNLSHFQDETAVERALISNAFESGVYVLPHADKEMTNSSDPQIRRLGRRKQERMAKGPFAFVVMSLRGTGAMSVLMLRGLAIQMVGALLMTWLLMQTGPISYRRRVFFVMVVAAAAGVLGHLPQWNWWGFPDRFILLEMLDLLAAWFLAGLVLAKVVPVFKKK